MIFKKSQAAITACLLATLTLVPVAHSSAADVVATGTSPSICNQQVSDTTGVTAIRLSGGDCLVKFSSTAASTLWTAPTNLFSVTYLVVGGGGSGGTGWDSTGAAGGGGGMVLTGTLPIYPASTYQVIVGAGGNQSVNSRTYNNGYSGALSKFAEITALGGGFGYTSRAHSGVAQAGGLPQSGSVSAPTGGSSGVGGTGGAGGGGAGGAGGSASGSTAGSAGAGVSSTISGSAVTYGAGGAGGAGGSSTATGASGGSNTGKGGGGGIGGNAASASGGAGGSGVVMIRYSTTSPTVNSFALAGTPLQAQFRIATQINISVNTASRITFLSNGKKIGGCISIPTVGSVSPFTASCSWRPVLKGNATLTAYIKPNEPALASYSASINVAVVARTTRR